TKKNYLILDAYNANPSSMKSMIKSFAKMENKNKICVLGDMLELGSYAEIEHKKIIQLTKKLNLEIILVGEEFSKITTENTYKDIEELGFHLTKNHLKNKTILLKGSRGIRLEKLVEQL
ncbi:MAG: UDP-N-acetylmuramoyl-tripeptide--D-alanyl-D-alanine ligase, partial [Flavobacteriales bacterium]|nr:UDP-N-acetylmuramoyl-tripeptide--D-alanyl-D-alanine ligase [Flavobacteriales bacterium]